MKPGHTHYHDYLMINELLACQKPLTGTNGIPSAHDEHLFIITHQTYELWFRQVIIELQSVLATFGDKPVSEKRMGQAVSRLERVVQILRLLGEQIPVLETMTPMDFLEFRQVLFPASGFQSFQFRVVEILLGLRNQDRLAYQSKNFTEYLRDEQAEDLRKLQAAPSLFERVDEWLARTPFLENEDFSFWQEYRQAVKQMLAEEKEIVQHNDLLTEERRQENLAEIDSNLENFDNLLSAERFAHLREQGQWRLQHRSVLAALLILLYRDQPALHLPFRLLTALQDIDENLTAWRHRHAQMAHRMLGTKIGTGGSSGHKYLKAAGDKHKVFNDLFNLTTFLIPRSKLPSLPQELQRKMGFHYESETK